MLFGGMECFGQTARIAADTDKAADGMAVANRNDIFADTGIARAEKDFIPMRADVFVNPGLTADAFVPPVGNGFDKNAIRVCMDIIRC